MCCKGNLVRYCSTDWLKEQEPFWQMHLRERNEHKSNQIVLFSYLGQLGGRLLSRFEISLPIKMK